MPAATMAQPAARHRRDRGASVGASVVEGAAGAGAATTDVATMTCAEQAPSAIDATRVAVINGAIAREGRW